MDIQLKQNIPLAPLSTFGIGGIARKFISVNTPEELLEVIKQAQGSYLAYKVFAGGSNVVFPGKDLEDLVIQVSGGKIEKQENRFIADAGVLLMDVIKKAVSNGLSGLESLSGIPGTIGGAVVGNAGAYGHSISEVVEKVEVWDGKEKIWLDNHSCNFSYRESIFKKKRYLILRVVCIFDVGDKEELQKVSQNIIHLREDKYKPGLKCPGSFFKNIVNSEIDKTVLENIDPAKIKFGKIPAGYLLGEVGAKGMQVGGIRIADFHGNLFINDGNGTAEDVKKLAGILKNRVKEKFGIELEEEVRYF